MLSYNSFHLFLLLICTLIPSINRGQKSIPRTYTAYHTNSRISIDAKADEADWGKVAWSEYFTDIQGEKIPQHTTRFKMLWDNTYMYYYVEIEEPHVWANLRQRDTVVFYNNDFEIFWDPDGDTHNYYEFEINALHTIWDLFLTKPYRESNAAMDSWDIRGAKSAIIVNGTLNNPTDIDKGWQLELAIPWAAFRTSFGQNNLPVNEFWRINFSRVNWDFAIHNGVYERKRNADGSYCPEYNWVWSPQGVVNMHEPEKWGYVYFSNKKAGQEDSFTIPEEERIRWHLYELYRKVKAKKLNCVQDISQLPTFTLKYNNHILTPTIEKHQAGWNICIKTQKKTYLIREDGKYSILQTKEKQLK